MTININHQSDSIRVPVLTLNGTGGLVVQSGTTGERPASTDGTIRFNTSLNQFEGYVNGAWNQFAVTTSSGFLPLGGGTMTGTLTIGNLVQISASFGQASAPTYAFTGELDTGVYCSAANTLSIASGGAQVAAFAPTGCTIIGNIHSSTQTETRATPSISAGALTLNLANATVFEVTLNANITSLTISNPPASGTVFAFTLFFIADGTARTVVWPAAVKWPDGVEPTLTSTSGKRDAFVLYTSDGGTNYYAYVAGQNS